jgi:hypothetical protein
MFNYAFTDDHERAWNKFLTFIIKYIMTKENEIRKPSEIIISPASNNEQSSHNVVK